MQSGPKRLLVAYVSGLDGTSQKRMSAVRETWQQMDHTAPGEWELQCLQAVGSPSRASQPAAFIFEQVTC